MEAVLRAAADWIQAATGQPFDQPQVSTVGGGCINRGYRLQQQARRYFVKVNDAAYADMFAAEIDGLRQIAATQTIAVPEPLGQGSHGDQAFLVLAWCDMQSRGGDPRRLGADLARLHAAPGPDYFGGTRDNYIGTTPQPNRNDENWWAFFRDQRLQPLFTALAQQGITFRHGNTLCTRLESLFGDHQPQPSLVHGDLWTGNAAFLQDGTPIIFDCAAYYGDGEVDLAMSELFGGFGRTFFDGYREVRPIPAGYSRRRTLYNLYHILNHALLFGGGYAGQARAMITEVLDG